MTVCMSPSTISGRIIIAYNWIKMFNNLWSIIVSASTALVCWEYMYVCISRNAYFIFQSWDMNSTLYMLSSQILLWPWKPPTIIVKKWKKNNYIEYIHIQFTIKQKTFCLRRMEKFLWSFFCFTIKIFNLCRFCCSQNINCKSCILYGL